MDWQHFGESLLAWFLGSGAVAGLGNLLASSRLKKLEGRQTAQLETLKSELQGVSDRQKNQLARGDLVFKTHFDLEFKSYIELWNLCDASMDATAIVMRAFESDLSNSGNRSYYFNEAKNAITICNNSLNATRKQRPFIDQQIAADAINSDRYVLRNALTCLIY